MRVVGFDLVDPNITDNIDLVDPYIADNTVSREDGGHRQEGVAVIVIQACQFLVYGHSPLHLGRYRHGLFKAVWDDFRILPPRTTLKFGCVVDAVHGRVFSARLVRDVWQDRLRVESQPSECKQRGIGGGHRYVGRSCTIVDVPLHEGLYCSAGADTHKCCI